MAVGNWVASLTRQTLIFVCAGIVLAGGAAGFGLGYTVQHSATPAAQVARPKAKRKGARAVEVAKLQRLRTCLANEGLKWPKVPGGPLKFAVQVRKPPAGVPAAEYNKAVGACYLLTSKGKGKTRTPVTHTTTTMQTTTTRPATTTTISRRPSVPHKTSRHPLHRTRRRA
ncbi:MAG TPA: hypothetical protein VEZ15_09075 [Acidimicrobiia bacterium]|nr:hypothetical protein [Acidimicrobiia bacterium]